MEFLSLKLTKQGKIFSLLSKREILRNRLTNDRKFYKANKATYKEISLVNSKMMRAVEKFSKGNQKGVSYFGVDIKSIVKVDNWEIGYLEKLDI